MFSAMDGVLHALPVVVAAAMVEGIGEKICTCIQCRCIVQLSENLNTSKPLNILERISLDVSVWVHILVFSFDS